MKHCLGLLTAELHFETSHSLKDRRSLMTSIKERLRHRFNVSVAEADFGDKWQRGGLIVSCAGSAAAQVEESLRAVLSFVENDPRLLVIDSQIRFYE
ncbi:MAG TPA: DUF503 domain-containing protein [bacterium]|jgi:hypothetical protein